MVPKIPGNRCSSNRNIFLVGLITAHWRAEKKKAESEKRRATFVDLFTVLNEEPECYGNPIQLMKIALTLPLASCSAERAFSKLKIIKSRLRSTMNQERLQSLMFMSIESDRMEGLYTEKLVQDFVDISPRRMNSMTIPYVSDVLTLLIKQYICI